MRKTILIPIDGRVESLATLRMALQNLESHDLHIVLMYSEYLNDSITDLLFYNAAKRLKTIITPAFEEALSVLKNRYETSFQSISIELFHGATVNAFRNFAAAKKIDIAWLPGAKSLKPAKNGFDPSSLIKKSGIAVHVVEWAGTTTSNSTLTEFNFFFK